MKSRSIVSTVLVSAILLVKTSMAGAAVHEPQLQIPRVSVAPVIDGKLEDGAWQKSATLSEFVNWSLDSYINDKVTVYLCRDDKNLYVAFRNADPSADDLNRSVSPKGPRDTFLWGRNHVSVSVATKDLSVRMMADPKGTMTDWKNEDIAWNGTWEYGAMINKTDWTAEYSLPLSELGMKSGSATSEFELGLSRSYPRGESSNWSGTCSFAGSTGAIAEYGRWPVPRPGKNHLSFLARNTGKETIRLILELKLMPLDGKPEFVNQSGQGASSDVRLRIKGEPLVYRYDYSVPSGGSVNENAEYLLPSEGSYFASAEVRLSGDRVIRRSVDYWFSIEPNRQKLAVLKDQVGESLGATSGETSPIALKYREEAEELLASVLRLQKDADESWNNGTWDDLTSVVADKELEVARHLHKVRWTALNNWKNEYDFGIALTHPVIKLRRDALYPMPLNDMINISLARNEYESFQLAILPFGKKITDMAVEVSDLREKGGASISGKNIEVSLVGYNNITWQADYAAERKGWHPDPLIPVSGPVSLGDNDVCRPLWITVHAPAGTKSGEYSGTVTLKGGGMKSITARIICRIRDFELPLESHLKTHSWDETDYFRDFYNLEEFPVEWYERFCDLLLKNRMNPGSAGVNYVSQIPDSKGEYDFSRVEKVLGFCIERGLSRFSIIQMKKGLYTDEEAEQAYRFVEAYTRFLKSKGWLDRALVELWDEPTDLEWPYIKERAERLKKIDPDLRLQLFAEGGPYDFWDSSTDKYGLNSLVNIWAPVNIIESPESQARGTEIWTYFCTLARESAPNFYIDCPAINQRSIAWYCWMYGVDGFEHWSTNYFWRNVRKGEPVTSKWPYVPWDSRTYYYFNGEGQLVYPGADGIPYSSVRLENFRDGMEDYEYLYKLRELLEKFSYDTSDPMLNQYRQLLNPEEYLLYKYPRKIKVTLENTLRHPDQPEMILSTREKIAMAIEDLQRRGNK